MIKFHEFDQRQRPSTVFDPIRHDAGPSSSSFRSRVSPILGNSPEQPAIDPSDREGSPYISESSLRLSEDSDNSSKEEEAKKPLGRTRRSTAQDRDLSSRGAQNPLPCTEYIRSLLASRHEDYGKCFKKKNSSSLQCWKCTTHTCTPLPIYLRSLALRLLELWDPETVELPGKVSNIVLFDRYTLLISYPFRGLFLIAKRLVQQWRLCLRWKKMRVSLLILTPSHYQHTPLLCDRLDQSDRLASPPLLLRSENANSLSRHLLFLLDPRNLVLRLVKNTILNLNPNLHPNLSPNRLPAYRQQRPRRVVKGRQKILSNWKVTLTKQSTNWIFKLIRSSWLKRES